MGKDKKKKKYIPVMTFETPKNMDVFFENFVEEMTTGPRKILFMEEGPRDGYSTVLQLLTAGMEPYFHVVFDPMGSHTEVSYSTDVVKEGAMKLMMGMTSMLKKMAKPHIKASVKDALKKS